jgi:hypothetical protein
LGEGLAGEEGGCGEADDLRDVQARGHGLLDGDPRGAEGGHCLGGVGMSRFWGLDVVNGLERVGDAK